MADIFDGLTSLPKKIQADVLTLLHSVKRNCDPHCDGKMSTQSFLTSLETELFSLGKFLTNFCDLLSDGYKLFWRSLRWPLRSAKKCIGWLIFTFLPTIFDEFRRNFVMSHGKFYSNCEKFIFEKRCGFTCCKIKVTMKRMRGIALAKLIIWFKSIHISIVKHTNNLPLFGFHQNILLNT